MGARDGAANGCCATLIDANSHKTLSPTHPLKDVPQYFQDRGSELLSAQMLKCKYILDLNMTSVESRDRFQSFIIKKTFSATKAGIAVKHGFLLSETFPGEEARSTGSD